MRWLVLALAIGIIVVASKPKSPPPPAAQTLRVNARNDAPVLTNRAPYIPVQCYAKTKRDNHVSNSCATCHRASQEPNYVSDEDVQTRRSFPAYATENHWTNALHPPAPMELDDASTLAYVRKSNYEGFNDCAFNPDADGWDRNARGELTGWRSYAYVPLPGAFWPTNGGSMGDAYIRLPVALRGEHYAVNLAIAEAMMRRTDVAIAPTDEKTINLDLDGDGKRGIAKRVKYRFPNDLHYVGDNASKAVAGLMPQGTEIMHSLRYLDVVDGVARPAARMKEVRYMRKDRRLSYAELDLRAKREAREKEQNPDELRTIFGDENRGIGTGTGWTMKGLIEAADGSLRPQSFEETAACIGCHSGIGATTDSTFSFARKTAWGPQALGKIDTAPYFAAVGAGDDYGINDELKRDPTRVIPSPPRALALDRAYLAIVRAQSYIKGRDVFLAPPNVEKNVAQDAPTGITTPLTGL